VLEAGHDATMWRVVERDASLSEVDDLLEPITQDAAQGEAAYRQLTLDGVPIGWRQSNGEQTPQAMIEECHALAWPGGAREQLGEQGARQARPERSVTGRTEAQAVALLTINGTLVPLEDLDFDVVCPESLG